ncbi:MAG: hypothetical protein ACREQ5_30480 [Candidatus Dormibacteria bacterium]
MIRRREPWLCVIVAVIVLVVGIVVTFGFHGAATFASVTSAAGFVISAVGALSNARGRRTRSSGWSGGVGGLRVCRGGTLRRVLRACISVDRLVDYLLDRAVDKLPAAARARFAEEWRDHRTHYSGRRLVWWALCVRATTLRTVTALGEPARLPRDR